MYKSPIDVIISDIATEMIKKQDEQIYKAVQNVGVNVDKHELLKALNYDRQQYDKGYRDGLRDFAERYKEQTKNYTGMFTVEGFYVSHGAMLSAVNFVYYKMTGEELE